jgi:hypothetical protein
MAAAAKKEPQVFAPDALAVVARAEIDGRVATARAYPRRIEDFEEEMARFVETDDDLCAAGYYSLQRQGRNGVKLIQGPSVRFAEVVIYSWRNAEIGTRYAGESEGGNAVLVQGIAYDYERNLRVADEITRSIVGRKGRRFSADMVVTTIRAAGAIARRNVILGIVPRVVFKPFFDRSLVRVLGLTAGQTDRYVRLEERAQEVGLDKRQLAALLQKELGRIPPRGDLRDKEALHVHGVLNAVDDGMLDLESILAAEEGGGDGPSQAAREILADDAARAEPPPSPADDELATPGEIEQLRARAREAGLTDDGLVELVMDNSAARSFEALRHGELVKLHAMVLRLAQDAVAPAPAAPPPPPPPPPARPAPPSPGGPPLGEARAERLRQLGGALGVAEDVVNSVLVAAMQDAGAEAVADLPLSLEVELEKRLRAVAAAG